MTVNSVVVCLVLFAATSSLASSMNLSARCNKTRRRPGRTGLAFGLPLRVKMPLPSVKEPGDDLDGISQLDCTLDDSQQSYQPEVVSASQGNHKAGVSVSSVSCSSELNREIDVKDSTGTSHSAVQNQGHNKGNETEESVFVSQTGDKPVSNQQWNACDMMQEGSQSSTTNPHSATLNNISTQHQAKASSNHQQGIQAPQMSFGQEGPTLHLSHSITGESDAVPAQRQNSSSLAAVFSNSGSYLQPHIPQASHSGQLQAIPGQNLGMGFVMGYPLGTPFANPAATQASQGTIVVKGKSYQRLGTIGKGGSSKVRVHMSVRLFRKASLSC